MAKQDDYVRTQVRLDKSTYDILKEYCESNNTSMNYAINHILYSYLQDVRFKENTPENYEKVLMIAKESLQGLSLEEIITLRNIMFFLHLHKEH